MAGTTMSLKLLIDSRVNQVVFGETSNDLVDFLFSLLRLPLSTVISLLNTDGIIGSIENIYSSIQNMDDAYMASSESKSAILKPKAIAKQSSSSYAAWHTQPLYTCFQNHSYVTYDKSVECPNCSPSYTLIQGRRAISTNTMSREMKYVSPISPNSSSKMESYVQGLVTYMVTDELFLSPMSVVSGITLLTRYNLQIGDLEEYVVKFQLDHLELDFLECSLKSNDSVLTHIFLENKLHLRSHEITKTGKTVSLKLLVDTIHQRVIFAEAGKDFVDFLCSLLLFPLGTIIRRLTGDTQGRDVIGCIGNIFTSVQDLDERYMPRNQSKDNFLMPDQSNYPSNIPLLLPNHDDSAAPSGAGILYTCYNCFPTSYCSDVCATRCPSCNNQMSRTLVLYPETGKDNTPNVGPNVCLATFAVTDDLCITPLSLISQISTLSARFITQPVNLEARVVEFGMSEGLKILKASLQSKTALTDVYCEARQISIEDDVQSD